MSAQANYFRIGAFIIAGMLLLAGGLVTFGVGQFFRQKMYLETYVDATVQGIEVGSPVKFRGVTVGKVTQVGFLFTEYPRVDRSELVNYVVILLEIDKEIFPGMFDQEDMQRVLSGAIDRGLRIKIEPQGITGLNYMEINYVDASRFAPIKITWKPHHFYIPYAPGELTSLLDSVNKMMREVENLNIEGIGKNLLSLIQNVDDAVKGAKFDELSTDARNVFASVNKAVEDAEVKELSADTRRLLAEIQKSNEELRSILTNIEPASRLNADDVAATLANLRIISENLRAASGDLSRDPSRLIFSRPPKPASVMEPPNSKKR